MQQHAIRAKAQKADGTDGGGRPNLLRHLAHSDMPLSELHEKRLAKEAFTVLSAGVHTTARTLEFISYHIIKNQLFKLDLQKELEPIMADYPQTLPSVSQLEALPYLSALIKESHRLVSRSKKNGILIILDWVILLCIVYLEFHPMYPWYTRIGLFHEVFVKPASLNTQILTF